MDEPRPRAGRRRDAAARHRQRPHPPTPAHRGPLTPRHDPPRRRRPRPLRSRGRPRPLRDALAALPKARVTVHAAAPIGRALRDALAIVVPGIEAWLGPRLDWHTLPLGVPVALADLTLTAFPVEHRIPTTGFRIAQQGHTLTFSADTVPCAALDAAAHGADLLIHEAYGLDERAAVAHDFGHATAADAGRTARVGNVARLILTHLRGPAHADPAALIAEAAAHYPGPLSASHDLEVVA